MNNDLYYTGLQIVDFNDLRVLQLLKHNTIKTLDDAWHTKTILFV